MNPACTVAIPVYARHDALLNQVAVRSALAHAPSDAEILVVDDCSDESTWQTLSAYSDPRLRLVRNERNLGLFGNFNRCLELAAAPVVRILCSDDALEPGALAAELALLARHPGATVLTTQGVRVAPAGEELGRQADHLPPGYYRGDDAVAAVLWFKSHYGLNPLNYPSGVLLRRDAALRAGGFDTRMRMAGDVDLFLRMLREGGLLVTRSVGCRIGIHPDQEGAKLASDPRIMEEDFELVSRHRDVLERAGVYTRVRQQFGGVALGLAQRCWRQGHREAARALVDVARQAGITAPEMVVALTRLVVLRGALRGGGIRRTPVGPTSVL